MATSSSKNLITLFRWPYCVVFTDNFIYYLLKIASDFRCRRWRKIGTSLVVQSGDSENFIGPAHRVISQGPCHRQRFCCRFSRGQSIISFDDSHRRWMPPDWSRRRVDWGGPRTPFIMAVSTSRVGCSGVTPWPLHFDPRGNTFPCEHRGLFLAPKSKDEQSTRPRIETALFSLRLSTKGNR